MENISIYKRGLLIPFILESQLVLFIISKLCMPWKGFVFFLRKPTFKILSVLIHVYIITDPFFYSSLFTYMILSVLIHLYNPYLSFLFFSLSTCTISSVLIQVYLQCSFEFWNSFNMFINLLRIDSSETICFNNYENWDCSIVMWYIIHNPYLSSYFSLPI